MTPAKQNDKSAGFEQVKDESIPSDSYKHLNVNKGC